MVNSYMLKEVGLRFPLPADLCYLLNGLKMSLECCKSNVLQLLMGVAFANQKLNIYLGDREVLANYIFKVDRGEPYFKLAPSDRPMVIEVESYHNRDWKRFPKMVVSGN